MAPRKTSPGNEGVSMTDNEEVRMTDAEQAAYRDGAQAFHQDRPNSDNPHPPARVPGEGFNKLRYQWFMGWYDAKVEHLV